MMPIFDRIMCRFEWYFGIVEGVEDITIGIYENTVLTAFSSSGVGLLATYRQFLSCDRAAYIRHSGENFAIISQKIGSF